MISLSNIEMTGCATKVAPAQHKEKKNTLNLYNEIVVRGRLNNLLLLDVWIVVWREGKSKDDAIKF